MPDDSEVKRPEEEEDGGGAVKSFLDHLEDLRWTIIKSAAAVTVGMVICLGAGSVIMEWLRWPLERAAQMNPGKGQYLTLLLGTNRLGTTKMEGHSWGPLGLGKEQHLVFRLLPRVDGTNLSLELERVTNHIADIFPKTPVSLFNPSPTGGFMVAFQLAIYGGIVLASPFILYYVGLFIMPALKRKEKKYLFRGLGIGSGLFFSGVAFCYFVLMPLALNASRMYSNWLGIGADLWTAEQYIGFVCKFMLGMGLGFEMPVVLLILVKIGILDYQKLAGFRRYMIVVNLLLGALLTTPEVLTQIMMAVPLQVLFEVSVWIAWYWERQEKRRMATMNLSPDVSRTSPPV
ncbi:MAG: twin-arginine translocase subunit TatC [Candidatus Omnitrophica bacterium]|nr:twin-arginine translocase subunit TatC [Candidatus Omnitrophota bacterium]